MIIYPALFHREDGSYWAEFPDLEGCHTFGDTVEEVYSNAQEALAAYCETLIGQRRSLSVPTDITRIAAPQDGFVSYVDASVGELQYA